MQEMPKQKIIAALVQEILKTKNNTIQEEEDRLIIEIARLKYNKGEYPNEALLNAVRDGMQAKCSDGESLISVLIQEHALLIYLEDYEHSLGIE
jgi:hypothetical protein